MKRFTAFLMMLGAAFACGAALWADDNKPANANPPAAAADDPAGVRLTIYNNNFALVKDRRELPDELKQGINIIRFRDVAATLDPTSVNFRSLTDPEATVVEQNYEFDLVSGEKLLQKYIDKKITVHTQDGRSYEGTLMSFDARQLVLAQDKEKGPIFMVERGENIKRIQFSTLPEGLLTRPTLVWEVEARKPGKHLVEVSYIAQQMRWRSDYNIVLNADDTAVDLSGWVTIENNTGTTYPDARLKLLAGEPRVDYTQMPWGYGHDYYKLVRTLAPTDRKGADPSRAIGDYRMYTLSAPTTVNSNQIKQIELITAAKVPVTKTYVYDGAKITWYRHGHYFDPGYGRGESNKKVNVLVEIENRADQHLGIALPKGKARVYKKDTDGSLEFIGEDLVNHTARDERVVLYIGDAFDIVGERKQTEFQRITDRQVEEAFEIKVRNHKKEPVTVKVLEKLYRGGEWTVLQKSHDFEQIDSRTIIFPVTVQPDKEVTVTYRVRYQY
jgi:hypothetical protein